VTKDKVPLFILGFPGMMCMVHVIYITWSYVVGPILSRTRRLQDDDVSRVTHSSQGRLMVYTTCASAALCVCFVTMCTFTASWPAYLPDTDVCLGVVCTICIMPLTNQLGVDSRLMWVVYSIVIPSYYIYTYYLIGSSRVKVTPYEICASALAFGILLFDEACRESDLRQIYDTLSAIDHRDTLSHAGALNEGEKEKQRVLGLHEQEQFTNQFSATSDIAYTLNTIVESLKTLTELVDDSTEVVTPYEICASALAFGILLFDEACRESDLRQIYDTLSAIDHRDTLSHAGALNEGEKEKQRVLGLHEQEQFTNQVSASSDIAYTLNTIVESLKTLTELVDDSTEVVPLQNQNHNLSNKNAKLYQKKYVGYQWVKSAAHIYESRLLCLSIIMASIHDGSDILNVTRDILSEKEFKMSHLCHRLFSMAEATRGHALPLFSDESSTDALITAARGFCEILLYLLIYDAISETLINKDKGIAICWLRCSVVNGAWTITVSTTRLYDDNSMPSKLEAQENQESPLRLASSLAIRYLRKQLEVSKYVDQSNGIVVSHSSFHIPGKVLTIVADNDDLLYPSVNAAWLIVNCHVSTLDVRVHETLEFALRSLCIPYETCRGVDELHHWKQQHAVVIISDEGLSAKHLDVSLDLMRLNGGSLLVTLAKNSNKMLSYFKDHYDLDVTKCIDTSPKSIFHDLQAIYSSHKPRVLRDQKLCRSSY